MRLLEKNPRLKVLILEKEDAVAKHQSGRNSGVIHAGIYYKPGSIKAANCRKGYEQLTRFCQEEAIPYEICGKLIMATDEIELPRLRELHKRGEANGLTGLSWLNADEAREREPYCQALAALWVPQTGIVDYRQVAKKFASRFQNAGGQIEFGQKVLSLRGGVAHAAIQCLDRTWFAAKIVNCAGLYSDKLAKQQMPEVPIRILPFRGEYYKLRSSGQHLVRNLIYPVPNPEFPFLGVHFTRMMRGGVECGPNAVLALGREAYARTDFNARDLWEMIRWPGFQKMAQRYWRMGLDEQMRSLSKKRFTRALQKLVPAVQECDLEQGGSGIRAQACDLNGNLLDDFDIRVHENMIHVCNAPSPAATSSLAIADRICEVVH